MTEGRVNEGASTTGGEDPSVVTGNARGGDVPRPANGHRWLPTFRARLEWEERSGTALDNARRLFGRAEAMGDLLLASGSMSGGPLVLAREDTPEPTGAGFSSVLIIWLPGDGFGLMACEGGETHLLETYHSAEEMARGRIPYRLLLTATRNLLADDAGARLVRLQENTRRLQEWEREGAERPEAIAPLTYP